MPTYYFNLIGARNARDDEGAEFTGPVAAMRYALEVAHELRQHSNVDLKANALQIIDQKGNEVCVVGLDGVVRPRNLPTK